jgi:cytochrome c551/c552
MHSFSPRLARVHRLRRWSGGLASLLGGLVGALCLTTACGSVEPTAQPRPTLDQATAAAGEAARGQLLFQQTLIGSQNGAGCTTCHALAPGVVLVGPALAGIGERAQQTIGQADYQGQATNAAAYLREAIIQPNAYVANGFQPDVMRATYGVELTAPEIEDLVAFLLTLK